MSMEIVVFVIRMLMVLVVLGIGYILGNLSGYESGLKKAFRIEAYPRERRITILRRQGYTRQEAERIMGPENKKRCPIGF